MSRTYKDRPYRVAARQDRGPVHEWHRGCEQADPVYRRRTVVTESAPHWHEEELTVHGRPAWAYEDFDSWRLVDADGRPSFSGMVRPVLPSLCLPLHPAPAPARHDCARLLEAPLPGQLLN